MAFRNGICGWWTAQGRGSWVVLVLLTTIRTRKWTWTDDAKQTQRPPRIQ